MLTVTNPRICLCNGHFPCLSQQDGWNQNHFLTPVSTLERDRFKSQPTLPTSTIQMSPINHPSRLTHTGGGRKEGRTKTSRTCPLLSRQRPAPCPLLPCWE